MQRPELSAGYLWKFHLPLLVMSVCTNSIDSTVWNLKNLHLLKVVAHSRLSATAVASDFCCEKPKMVQPAIRTEQSPMRPEWSRSFRTLAAPSLLQNNNEDAEQQNQISEC